MDFVQLTLPGRKTLVAPPSVLTAGVFALQKHILHEPPFCINRLLIGQDEAAARVIALIRYHSSSKMHLPGFYINPFPSPSVEVVFIGYYPEQNAFFGGVELLSPGAFWGSLPEQFRATEESFPDNILCFRAGSPFL